MLDVHFFLRESNQRTKKQLTKVMKCFWGRKVLFERELYRAKHTSSSEFNVKKRKKKQKKKSKDGNLLIDRSPSLILFSYVS